MGKRSEQKMEKANTPWDSTFQRRLKMMYYISWKRRVTYRELEAEFGITSRMVSHDLDSLNTDFHVPLIRDERIRTEVEGFWHAEQPRLSYETSVRLAALRKYLPAGEVEYLEDFIRKYGDYKAL